MIEIWHGEGNDAFCYLNVPDRPAGRPADQLCSWLAARSCRWVRTLFSEMLDRSSRMASLMASRSEEHTSELQSQSNLVCRLLLEKKKDGEQHPSEPPEPRPAVP